MVGLRVLMFFSIWGDAWQEMFENHCINDTLCVFDFNKGLNKEEKAEHELITEHLQNSRKLSRHHMLWSNVQNDTQHFTSSLTRQNRRHSSGKFKAKNFLFSCISSSRHSFHFHCLFFWHLQCHFFIKRIKWWIEFLLNLRNFVMKLNTH